jgi:hypothetical protein
MKCLLVIVWITFEALFAACGATSSPPRIYRDKIDPHWFAIAGGETNRFWYRLQLPHGGKEFVLVDAAAGTRQPAFDEARMAKTLTELTGQIVEPKKPPFDSLEFAPDGKTLTLFGGSSNWIVNLESYTGTVAAAKNLDEGNRLRAGRRIRPSRSSTAETTIRFVNHLTQDVDLFWVDEDGARQSYGSVKAGEDRDQHTYVGHTWLIASHNGDPVTVFYASENPGLAVIDETNKLDLVPSGEPERNKARVPRSPDGRWEVSVRDHNVFVRDNNDGNEQQLTQNASAGSSYARNAQFNRGIDMEFGTQDPEQQTPEIYWAPDSRHFVAMRFQPGAQRRVYEVESSPKDQLQPKLVSYPYLKPGDDVPYAKPHLFEVENKREISVDDSLFANPWSISDVRWNPDSSRFTFLFNQRGHQVLRIIGVDANTGAVKPIVDEASKTFICYSSKFFASYLDDTGEIVWMSERDGWNHLYLYDAKTGAVKNQITKGEWVVREVDRVDKIKRQIWFRAGGLRPGEDPYYVQNCRINFDGSGLTAFTGGDGTHTVQFSADNRFAIDTWSRVDLPPVNDLRLTDDGKLVCRLEETDTSELMGSGWRAPEPCVAKGRDGLTDIYGVVRWPKNFDPKKKYPVLEDIYAGPHGSFVPKRFEANNLNQSLTDHGFIVVQIDGMGTSNRSKKFHDVCWKNLQDSGFPDRIAWISWI